MSSAIVLIVPTTTTAVRVTRLRKLPVSVDQATLTLSGSSAALPVSARYSDFVRAPMGPIERSSGHGAWKAEVSAALDVGESWNLGLFLAHALKAHGRLQEQQSDVPGDTPRTVWATGAVDVIDLRILPVGHVETKLRQALVATPVPDLFVLPPDNLGDVPAELRADFEARGTQIIAPTTMAEVLVALELPSDWAKEAAPDLAGWRGDPYRGLEPYQAEHRPIFFGRASARAEALERLRTRAERGTSLMVIHGKSGVGKSSLAMAGLLDDVVEQVPGRAPFGAATIRFGDGATPLAALHAGFAQALGLEAASTLPSSSTTEWLATWQENTEPRTALLILDQLEQALLADEADTIAFGEAIATLVQTGRVWVIATLRSDRIDLLERAPALAEIADGDALYRLVRPTLAELDEIIRAPAKLAGIEFEEGNGTDLVNLLAEEAMRAPDSLPLLQVTLMRLADQRDGDGRVGMRDYERIGGFSGAVGRLADETVRKMEAEGIDSNVVDRTLAGLVRIDPDTDRVDARVVDPDVQTAEVQQVLSALVEARLATASTESEALDPEADHGSVGSTGPNDSDRRVRLAHETLIREWPRLHDLAARLRSELGLRDRLEDDALRWDQDGRPQGDLIRNAARLTAAEALVADGLATPSPQAQTYIEASRREVDRRAEEQQAAEVQERRTRTRRRITTVAALVAVVILGMAGLLANLSQQTRAAQQLAEAANEAQESASRFVARRAMELLVSGETEDAMALALRSLPLPETPGERPMVKEAELAAIRAYSNLRAVNMYEFKHNIEAVAVSHDERLVAVGGGFLGLQLFDLATNTVRHAYTYRKETARGEASNLPISGGVVDIEFHPTDRMIVTGGYDGNIRFWSVRDGHLYFSTKVSSVSIDRVVFTPDGNRLVVMDSNGVIQRSSRGSWKYLRGFEVEAEDFWISADSKRLLVMHKRPKRELPEESPEPKVVLTTFDMLTREVVSTRSFPEREVTGIGVAPEGDGVFIFGQGMVRESAMGDLSQETMVDVPKKFRGTRVVFSEASDKALVPALFGEARILTQEGEIWTYFEPPKRIFSLTEPSIHVPQIYDDFIGFARGGTMIWGLNNNRDAVTLQRVAVDGNGMIKEIEIPLGYEFEALSLHGGRDTLAVLNSGAILTTHENELLLRNPWPRAVLDFAHPTPRAHSILGSPSGEYAVVLGEGSDVLHVAAGQRQDPFSPYLSGHTREDAPVMKITPFARNLDKGQAVTNESLVDISFSPDGRYVMTEIRDSNLGLDSDTHFEVFDSKTLRRVMQFTNQFREVRFSMDSRSIWVPRLGTLTFDTLVQDDVAQWTNLAQDAKDGLSRIDLTNGDVELVVDGTNTRVFRFDLSRDGRRIMISNTDQIRIYDQDGVLLQSIDAENYNGAGITADGRFVLHVPDRQRGTRTQTLELYDTETGEMVRTVEGLSAVPDSYLYSSDPSIVYFEGSVSLGKIDLVTGTVVWQREDQESFSDEVVLSADETLITTRRGEDTGDLISTETGEILWKMSVAAYTSIFEPNTSLLFHKNKILDVRTGLVLADYPKAPIYGFAAFLTKHNLMLRVSHHGEMFLTRYWLDTDDFLVDAHNEIMFLNPLTLADKCSFNLVSLEECL